MQREIIYIAAAAGEAITQDCANNNGKPQKITPVYKGHGGRQRRWNAWTEWSVKASQMCSHQLLPDLLGVLLGHKARANSGHKIITNTSDNITSISKDEGLISDE